MSPPAAREADGGAQLKKTVTYTFPKVVFLKARNVSGERKRVETEVRLGISAVGGWDCAKLQFVRLLRRQETRDSKI